MEDMQKRSNCSFTLISSRKVLIQWHTSSSQRKRAGAAEEAIHEARQVCTHPRIQICHENLTPSLDENSDGSGSIDREEFLQIPQIANNPLAYRLIAIFDEE